MGERTVGREGKVREGKEFWEEYEKGGTRTVGREGDGKGPVDEEFRKKEAGV